MEYVARGSWGATPSKRPFTPLRAWRVKGVVIHHSGVNGTQDGPSAVRSFERYHRETRGWNAIAYNVCVDRQGVAYDGRGLKWQGGATKGWNSRSVAICYTGWGDDPIPDAALETIAAVIKDAESMYGDLWVKPHSAFKSTGCPGSELRSWVEAGCKTVEAASVPAGSMWDAIRAYCEALGASLTHSPLSRRRRSRGEAVRVLQGHLNHLGYGPLVVDGAYGRRCAAAVKAFQKSRPMLANDGVVGPATWHSLFSG
jgi:hypothetical protein